MLIDQIFTKKLLKFYVVADDDNDDDEGLSDRAIAGIVVGTTVPLVLICILGAILLHRRRSSGHFTPKQLSMKKVGSKKVSMHVINVLKHSM